MRLIFWYELKKPMLSIRLWAAYANWEHLKTSTEQKLISNNDKHITAAKAANRYLAPLSLQYDLLGFMILKDCGNSLE